jgi:hypothetical protein
MDTPEQLGQPLGTLNGEPIVMDINLGVLGVVEAEVFVSVGRDKFGELGLVLNGVRFQGFPEMLEDYLYRNTTFIKKVSAQLGVDIEP